MALVLSVGGTGRDEEVVGRMSSIGGLGFCFRPDECMCKRCKMFGRFGGVGVLEGMSPDSGSVGPAPGLLSEKNLETVVFAALLSIQKALTEPRRQFRRPRSVVSINVNLNSGCKWYFVVDQSR